MITVRMDEQDAIDLLVNRVEHWTDDSEIIDLFEEYYTNMVEGGCFDGADFNVMSIVDNDYVNNTSTVTREEFEKDRKEYIQNELKDRLEDLEEDDETTEEELKEALEENNITWEDLERGENTCPFLSGYYIEAIKGDCLLIS